MLDVERGEGMFLLGRYVGEPISYICCVFQQVRFCLFSDFRVDIVENLFSDFSEFTFSRFMRRLVGWLAKLSLWS